MADEVLFETRGPVALITLNRPQAHNAMDRAMLQGLRDALGRFREERELRVAVLTGAGDRAFCSGMDMQEVAATTPAGWAEEFWHGYHQAYPECWKPVIAAVNGSCDAEALDLLVSVTDIRIASEGAIFCYAGVLRGFAGYGPAVEWLPRSVPYAIAMEWLLTGKVVSAQEAYRFGLVNEVVPQEELLPRALEVAQHLAGLAPLAVRAIKEAAVRSVGMDIPTAVRFAYMMGVLNRFTEDAQEGPRAFAEKRKPRYQGR